MKIKFCDSNRKKEMAATVILYLCFQASAICFEGEEDCVLQKSMQCFRGTGRGCTRLIRETFQDHVNASSMVFCTGDGKIFRKVRVGNTTFVRSADCANCSTGVCEGSSEFCMNYGCSPSICNCVMVHKREEMREMRGIRQTGKRLNYAWVRIGIHKFLLNLRDEIPGKMYDNGRFEIENVEEDHEEDKKRNVGKRLLGEPEVYWNQPIISFNLPHDFNATLVIITKGVLTETFFASSPYFLYTLTHAWLLDASDLRVRIYLNTDLQRDERFHVEPIASCEIPRDITSPLFRQNFDCLPISMKAIFCLFFIFCSATFLLVMAVIWYVLKDKIGGSRIDIRNIDTTMVLLMAFFILLAGASHCDQSLITSSKDLICYDSGANRTCHLSSSFVFTLSTVGGTLCLEVVDGNTHVGNLSLTWMESIRIHQMTQQYYTTLWFPAMNAAKYCPGTSYCNSQTNCATCFGQCSGVSGTSTRLPGRTRCSSSCGCAGCGCFLCSDACTYFRTAFSPFVRPDWPTIRNGTFGVVYKVGSSIRKDKLLLCYHSDHSNETCSSYYVSAGYNSFHNSEMVLQIVGSLADQTIILPAKDLVSLSDGRHFFVDAASAGDPLFGKIGDIQANTLSSLTAVDPSFLIPQDIISCDLTQNGATCNYPNSAFDDLLTGRIHYNRIDDLYAGVSYTVSNLSLISVDHNPGALVGSLTADNITFTEIIGRVCPKVRYISSGGHYSSMTTPWILVAIKSICASGRVVLRSETTVITSDLSFMITTEETRAYISFTSNARVNLVIITFAGSGSEETISEQIILKDPIVLVPNSSNDHVTAEDTAQSSWFLDLSVSSKAGLISGAVVGGLLVALGILSFALLLYSHMAPKQVLSYESLKPSLETK